MRWTLFSIDFVILCYNSMMKAKDSLKKSYWDPYSFRGLGYMPIIVGVSQAGCLEQQLGITS